MSKNGPKAGNGEQDPESKVIPERQPGNESSLPSQDVDLGMSVASSPTSFGGKQIRKTPPGRVVLDHDVIECTLRRQTTQVWNDLKKKLFEEDMTSCPKNRTTECHQ